MSSAKRVAIIGAGPAGLAAIKACKEEKLDPVCYERNGEPGGLWKYRDDDIEGVASVMKTTVINTSKEMSAFSDFPPPKDFPNFMHHSMMHRYFMMYAERFDLLRHIRYLLEVVKVEKTADHDDTGRWVVTVKSTQTEAVTKEEFDGVMVCIGHHVYPKTPAFPGQEKFCGTITHSHSVKNCENFSGQTVVVVGIGNSGVDAAVDSSHVAKQVYLSTRRGSWIYSRVGAKGRPYDMDFASRRKLFINSFKSFDRICSEVENELTQKFDHEAYNLKPKHRALSAHPTMNDSIPNCILSGRVVVKGDIKRFEETGVVFEGDDDVTECDVVILATGYLIQFPFLVDVVTVKDNRVHLYQYVFPLNMKHNTLGLIGLIQPLGPIFPIAEIQSRWFVQVLKQNISLPPAKDMEKIMEAKSRENAKRYVDSTRHTIQVEWIPYIDEIASEIGAKPNLWKLAITDPKLFSACFNGPCLPYQFRLQGPHAWPGARKAILEYETRVFAPLNSKGKTISLDEGQSKKKLLFLFVIGTAGLFYVSKYSDSIREVFSSNQLRY